jgi:hypothetical protein
MAKAAAKVGAKPAKPVFNAEGKMVFSKFDFTDDRGFKTDDPRYIFEPENLFTGLCVVYDDLTLKIAREQNILILTLTQ